MNPMKPMTAAEKLRALLESKRAKVTPVEVPVQELPVEAEVSEAQASAKETVTLSAPVIPATSADISLNPEQLRAVQLATTGHSFALTGPAGSGKTTTVRAVISALVTKPDFPVLVAHVHKYLPSQGVPGVAIVAFTNKAVSVIRKNLDPSLYKNCLTIHKLLEFRPVDEEIEDSETGKTRTARVFRPERDEHNPISAQIHTLIIEEASMVPVDLWNLISRACPHLKQLIMVGDIQQLPPVFGKSIYIHAMAKGIPTIELTQIYRQALESPIISLAHRVLSGKQLPAAEFQKYSIDSGPHGKVTIRPWKKTVSDVVALVNMDRLLPQLIDSGELDPEVDMILTPYNVNFGQIALNQIVATHQAKRLAAPVYEVFAGITKRYFRIGERVAFNKTEARIIDIQPNPAYYGPPPRDPSTTLDYKGIEHDPAKSFQLSLTAEQQMEAEARIDAILSGLSDHTSDDSPTARAASHKILVQDADTGVETWISAAGEVGKLDLYYAGTVHRSQGSEYPRVWLITHGSQASSIYRELLYTAITRAKQELIIFCEPNAFLKGISTQKYPGKNLEEKIRAFSKIPDSGNPDYIPQGLERFIGVQP